MEMMESVRHLERMVAALGDVGEGGDKFNVEK